MVLVRLKGPSRHIDVWALVDSGADECLFHAEVAEAIGIDWQSGHLDELSGADGSRFSAHYLPVTFEIGGHPFESTVGFSKQISHKAILGQHGFFDKAKITFDLPKESFEIILKQ